MSMLNKNEINNLLNALNQVEKEISIEYQKPVLKELTQKEIEAIHSSGNITPLEWITEMEEKYPEVCPFSNESIRCRVFADCHDCLVDYANTQGKFPVFEESIDSIISDKEKENFINNLNSSLKNEELEKAKVRKRDF